MKKFVFYFLTSLSLFVVACGGGKTKEEDNKKTEDTRPTPWQELLTACEETTPDKFPEYFPSKDITKAQLRHLFDLRLFDTSTVRTTTHARCQVGNYTLFAIAERYENKEAKDLDDYTQAAANTRTYFLSFDKQGKFINKLLVNQFTYEVGQESIIFEKSYTEGVFKVDKIVGREKNKLFEGEKISYQLDAEGKFKETGRKKYQRPA